MVPVDLTPASGAQAAAASSLAAALALPLTFIHVLEPVSQYWSSRLCLAAFEEGRTGKAQLELSNLLATVPASSTRRALIARGDPAEEVARAARDARAGLLVMGLHDAVVGTAKGLGDVPDAPFHAGARARVARRDGTPPAAGPTRSITSDTQRRFGRRGGHTAGYAAEPAVRAVAAGI